MVLAKIAATVSNAVVATPQRAALAVAISAPERSSSEALAIRSRSPAATLSSAGRSMLRSSARSLKGAENASALKPQSARGTYASASPEKAGESSNETTPMEVSRSIGPASRMPSTIPATITSRASAGTRAFAQAGCARILRSLLTAEA